MQQTIRAFLGLCLLMTVSSLSAQGRQYFMVGLGTQFDLAGLGSTITRDGLDSRNSVRDSQGNVTGGTQKVIYAENTLISLNRSTNGLVGVKTNGAMAGLNFNVGYEKEGIFGIESMFVRINVNHTEKVAGGLTTATFAGVQWLQQEWSYQATSVPVNLGIKVYNADKTAAIYLGGGFNYARGGWSVSGTIDGDLLRNLFPGLAGPGGVFLNDAPTPGVYKENAKFSYAGMGMNWLVGAQTKVSEKGHIFFEAETIINAGYGVAGVKSQGGQSALAPFAAYQILIAGTTYRVGYKHEF